MATPVEQIKERLTILDVVAPYVQLHKAGRNFKGKSPFTNEKTPSFFVSPDRGVYYCFSSGKGGDIFTFIQEVEGVDFKGALKILAERAHVELVPESPQKRTERETLYALLEAATVYFEEQLAKHAPIHAYLTKRAVSEASIAKWRIGYAPEGWTGLRDHLASMGFRDQMMLRAGLVKKKEGGTSYYDVFRDRAMFPISDASGRVVAFSGRAMGTDPKLPKYVNSPETELFQKSHVLFGYHLAKQGIRTYDFSLVVEGQFDLVLAHQAGFTNAVAISGTALTEQHVELISRLSSRAVLALDADRAGVNSVKRSAHVMLGRGMDVKVARIEGGKDPADLVREDPKLLKEAVRKAVTVIEFLIAVLKESARDDRAFRLSVRDEVLPFVVRIQDRIDRDHFEGVVATALQTTKDAVHHEVERIETQGERPGAETEAVKPDAAPDPVRTADLVRYLYGLILWQEGLGEEAVCDAPALRDALKEALGDEGWQHLEDGAVPERDKLIFAAELHCAEFKPAQLLSHAQGHLHEIQGRMLKTALARERDVLRTAEAAGDTEAAERALAECGRLQKRLSAIGT